VVPGLAERAEPGHRLAGCPVVLAVCGGVVAVPAGGTATLTCRLTPERVTKPNWTCGTQVVMAVTAAESRRQREIGGKP
jgi:hypothetical protein